MFVFVGIVYFVLVWVVVVLFVFMGVVVGGLEMVVGVGIDLDFVIGWWNG